MTPEDAEEYTQALGQVVAGGWRQVALGERLGVPKALGLSTRDWVEQRLGGYVRMSINERRDAVKELRAEGLEQEQIAEIVGVSQPTVSRYLAPDRPHSDEYGDDGKQGDDQREDEPAPDRPHSDEYGDDVEPLDAFATLVAQGLDEKARAKARARGREPEPVVEPVPLPAGKFQCVVIDPPWPMQKIERDERPTQGVELDYPTLEVWCRDSWYADNYDGTKERRACYEGIARDPDLAADYEPCKSIQCVVGHVIESAALGDCHIYLWVTHKFMPAGLELLDAWGFNYQCVMTWRKNVGMTPFSWMYDTEHVLFGRRGNLPLDRLGLRLSFDAPVNGHSVKPDVFYERVVEASPGPRVEMFARRERDGFVPWGNEVADAGV